MEEQMQEKRMPVMRNLKMKKSKLDSEDVNKRTEKIGRAHV